MTDLAKAVRAAIAAAALTLALPIGGPATAGSAYPLVAHAGDRGAGGSRNLELDKGRSVIIALPTDASEVFIGDPKVANAVVRSARRLYVIGVDVGQTSIYAMDHAGRQIADIEVTVGGNDAAPLETRLNELRRVLHLVLPKADIEVQRVGDRVILTGTVDTAGDAQKAADIAKGFAPSFVTQSQSNAQGNTAGGQSSDTTSKSTQTTPNQDPDSFIVNALTIRGKDQVMLKVSIVEIQRNIIKQLGISTTGSWSTGTFGPSPVSLTNASSILTSSWGGSGNSFSATLSALERYGVSRVLAEPTVTAISGENAKFTAGGEIPVPGSYTPASGLSPATVGIDFKQYGVTLNFAPVVLSEGRILLRVATEVTEIDQDRQYTYAGGISIPAFRTRKNETTVELPSGGSIVSAGLLQSYNRQVVTGVPGLLNLPVLGPLFRSRDYQHDVTELMIVVTPYIARAMRPEEIKRPDDGLRDASDPQGWFLGRINQIYSSANNPQMLHDFHGWVGFIND